MNQPKIHVRGDSDTNLNILFKQSLKPEEGQPVQVPMRLRKFPPSFFDPPNSSPHHSRQGSADSQVRPHPHPFIPQINHSKSHSSPANLDPSLSLSPQGHVMMRHGSYDLNEIPLPPGWQMAVTEKGEKYFLNHHLQTTTWHDPRLARSQSNTSLHSNPAASPQQHLSPAPSQTNLGPLMPGWEQAVTPDGEVYFINHVEKTTTWFDPRIPQHLQRPGVKLQQMQQMQHLKQMPGAQPGQPTPAPQGPQGYTSMSAHIPPVHMHPQATLPQQGHLPGLSLSEQPHMDQMQKLASEQQRLQEQQQKVAEQMDKLRQGGVEPMMMQPSTEAEGYLQQLHARQGSCDSGVGGVSSGTSSTGSVPKLESMVTTMNLGGMNGLPAQVQGYMLQQDKMETNADVKLEPNTALNGSARPAADFTALPISAVDSQMDSEEIMPSIPEDVVLDQILSSNNNQLLDDTWL